jgi:hypothetical protein
MLRLSLLLLFSAILLPSLALSQSHASALDPLTVYDGNWTYTTPSAPAKPDHLTNHCHMTEAFYTCEQVLNGKPVALLIFVAGDSPGVLHSQVILSNGNPAGAGSQLTIAGNHWTFLNKDSSGVSHRVENYILDHDHIRSEQYKSTDGTTWQKTGEGNEARIATD